MQVTIERISVREKHARFWKERSVEVAENSSAESARGSPPLRCGDITADVPGRPNHRNHPVSSACLHVVGSFGLFVPNRSLVLKCGKM